MMNLLLDSFAETSNGGSHGDGAGSVQSVGAAGFHLVATTAPPNTDSLTLDRIFTAKVAEILRVLRDFLLLNDLTEGGPVTRTVFPGDTCVFESSKEETNSVSSQSEGGERREAGQKMRRGRNPKSRNEHCAIACSIKKMHKCVNKTRVRSIWTL
jgi:hypothetical protein